MSSLDNNGRAVFSSLLEHADERALPIHWGTKGFSMNVDIEGTHVAVCFGYPPSAVYKQSVYTSLIGPGGVKRKTAVPDDVIDELQEAALKTGLFQKAGQDLKCPIDKEVSASQVDAHLAWCVKVEAAIKEKGLKE